MQDSPSPSTRQYAAFISYRHADNKEPGRQWATWLHQTLETYEIPPDLVGTKNLEGELIPAGLYPVFRDEEELPAHADLTMNIRKALENSRMLIVLCSPRAVTSKFVADEIRMFKELGKTGRILSLIIDGEPNASEAGAPDGLDPALECLPTPLRYGLPEKDGSINWDTRTEPIAADTRPEGLAHQGFTSPAAYRESLEDQQKFSKAEISERVTRYENQLHLAVLKVVAGAIGMPLGTLTQRDKARQLALAKRRAKRLRILSSAFALIALIAAAAGVFAWHQKNQADEQRTLADQQRTLAEQREHDIRESSSQSDFLSANEALRRDEGPVALAMLAKSIRTNPANREASERLLSMLLQREWMIPVRHFTTDQPVDHLIFHPDRRRLVIGSSLDGYEADGISTTQVRDILTGTLLSKPHRADRAALDSILSDYPSMSVLVPCQSHKGMPGVDTIPMPARDAGPWPLDGLGRWAESYNYLSGEAVSPDGKHLIAGRDMGLALFKIANNGTSSIRYLLTLADEIDEGMGEFEGVPQFHMTGWKGESTPMAVGCNNNMYWVISSEADLWQFSYEDKPTVKSIGKLTSEDHAPTHCAFSRDGRFLAALYPNGNLFVLSCPDFKVAHSGDAGQFYDPDDTDGDLGLSFADGSSDVILTISRYDDGWKTKSAFLKAPQAGEKTAQWQALPDNWQALPSGNAIVSKNENIIAFRRISDSSKLGEPMVHESFASAAALSSDDLFATGTSQGNVRVWKRLSASITSIPDDGQDSDDRDKPLIAISPDRQVEIFATGEERAQEFTIRRAGEEKDLSPPRHWDAFRSACFSPDGTHLLLSGAEGLDGSTRGASNEGAVVYRLADMEPLTPIMKHQSCWWAGYDPSGKTIATVGQGLIQLWQAAAPTAPPQRLNHEFVERVLWNPAHPTRLISIAPNLSVRIWNTQTSALIREVPWPVKPDPDSYHDLIAAAFDPAGTRFFTITNTGLILWDASSLEALCDPIPIFGHPHLPDWEFISGKIPWRTPDLNADPLLREALLSTADFIAGIRISDEGAKETIANRLDLIGPISQQLSTLTSSPEATALSKIIADPFLQQMASVPNATIETTLAWNEKLIALQDAVYNYTSPPYEGSEAWVLNRDRLTDFTAVLADARAANPADTQRVMDGLLKQWQTRTDSAAILTRWHFGTKTEENRKLALSTLTELLSAIDDNDNPQIQAWTKEWREDLR